MAPRPKSPLPLPLPTSRILVLSTIPTSEEILMETKHANHKHGATAGGKVQPEYEAWCGIVGRCTGNKGLDKKNYSGRGICVCIGLRDYTAFLAIIGLKPSPSTSVDRIDNDGHYSCGTCPQCEENWWSRNIRWATRKQQNANTRQRRELVLGTRRMSVTEWSEELGWHVQTLLDRLRNGWSVEDTLTIPPVLEKVLFHGDLLTWPEVERKTGVSCKTLKHRVSRGFSLEEAAALRPYERRAKG